MSKKSKIDGVVSVIIPAYNREEYIDDCIQSIRNQTYHKWEIILIDDGSTDGTYEKGISWARCDSRVKVFKQENQGPGIARNRGIKEASGEFIAFLDSDDFWRNEYALEKIMNSVDGKECDVIGTFYSIYKDRIFFEIPRHRSYFTSNEDNGKWVYFKDEQDCFGFCSYLYRNDFIIKNNLFFPDYLIEEDPPFLAKVLAQAEKYYVIPVEFATIRHRYKNWFTSEQKTNDCLRGMLDVLNIAQIYSLDKLMNQVIDYIDNNSKMIIKSIIKGNLETLRLIVKLQEQVNDKGIKFAILKFIISSMQIEIKRKANSFITEISKSSKLIIYGSGAYGRNFLNNFLCLSNQTNIVFAETAEPKNREVCGKECYRLDELIEYKNNAIVIVAVQLKSMQNEMILYLKSLGFNRYIVYDNNLGIVLECVKEDYINEMEE